jgi:hypothetical protein
MVAAMTEGRAASRDMSRREMLKLGARAGALAVTAPLIGSVAAYARALPPPSLDSRNTARRPAAKTTLKPPLIGFLDEAAVPEYDWMLGYVVDLDWSELQATAHGPIIQNTRMLSAISSVRAFNAAHPSQPPRGLKLRTGAAAGAPPDVQSIGGGPYKVTDPVPPVASGQVGAFWVASYQSAYTDFQTKLAAWLDPIPEVREVTMGLPALIFEEPFLRYSTTVLAKGKWNLTVDQKSFTAMLQAHTAWKTTRQDLAYNPYNAPGGDPNWTQTFLSTAREMFGAQLVNGNNSIAASTVNSAMYQAIASAGPPIYFQVAGASKRGSPAKAFDFAVSHGANSVEIFKYSSISQSLLQEYQSKLLANPT